MRHGVLHGLQLGGIKARIVALLAADVDFDFRAELVPDDFLHQRGGFGVGHKIHAAVRKRNLDIQSIPVKAVMATVEKAVCHNAHAVGFSKQVGHIRLGKGRVRVMRKNPDEVQIIRLPDSRFDAELIPAADRSGEIGVNFDNPLLLVATQTDRIRVCGEHQPEIRLVRAVLGKNFG